MLKEILNQFYNQKEYIEKAYKRLSEDEFFRRENDFENSVAILVKHIGGNFCSRYKNFLSEDGEKPWRKRDYEFITENDSYNAIIDKWNEGWQIFKDETDKLTEDDLNKKVYIRGKEHTVLNALLRSLTHLSYHSGQIVMLSKKLLGDKWVSLTIPKGQSEEFNKSMFSYDRIYREHDNYFGSEPEKLLVDNLNYINKNFPVLDVGAGDGRNSIYLYNNGFDLYALDPSKESINRINKKNSKINLINKGFLEYHSNIKFSAILLFGVMQIISKKDFILFIEKAKSLLAEKGLIFFTTFSIHNNSIDKYKDGDWEILEMNQFRKGNEYRSFYSVDEIIKMFDGNFEKLTLNEYLGPIHRHGNGLPEQHQIIEGIFRLG